MRGRVGGVRRGGEGGGGVLGKVDPWVRWTLTGGTSGGVHVTDVTNASRTMLMNLQTLDWDDELLGFFTVPPWMLPLILPSSTPAPYGVTSPPGPFGGELPVTGALGARRAPTVGQVCCAPCQAK